MLDSFVFEIVSARRPWVVVLPWVLSVSVIVSLPCCMSTMQSSDGRADHSDARDAMGSADLTSLGDGSTDHSNAMGDATVGGDAASAADGMVEDSMPRRDGAETDTTHASGLVHGETATVTSDETGASLGTRPNYNYQGTTWRGHSHVHWRFTDLGALSTGPISDGASVDGFDLQNRKNAGDGHTVRTGGPSQSGKYIRGVPPDRGVSTAALGATTPTTRQVPAMRGADMYVCFKMRTNAGSAGKVFRWWHNGDQYNWYQTPSAVVREPYPSSAVWCPNQNASNPGPTGQYYEGNPVVRGRWQRIEWFLYETSDACIPTSYLEVDNRRVGFTRGDVDRTKLGLVNSDYDNGLDVRLTWPNSLDAGGLFDYADIYVDFTAARIEITDGTTTEIQPVSSWTTSRIQFAFNKGELTSGPATLYVYDTNDDQIGAGVSVLVK